MHLLQSLILFFKTISRFKQFTSLALPSDRRSLARNIFFRGSQLFLQLLNLCFQLVILFLQFLILPLETEPIATTVLCSFHCMAFSYKTLYGNAWWGCEVIGCDHIIQSTEKTRISDEAAECFSSFIALWRWGLLIFDKKGCLCMFRWKVFDSLFELGVDDFHGEGRIEALGSSGLLLTWKSWCLWGYFRLA